MFLNPAQAVDKLDIRPGMKVADFGCGAGHFSVEMAKRAGKSGTIYAFDIKAEALSALKARIEVEHPGNIELRRVDLETPKGTQLVENLVDFVLAANVFFQIENKNAVVTEAFRILRPGGRAAVIDWDFSSGGLGPPKDLRVDKSVIQKMFLGAGFVFVKELETGKFHYGLIFQKPEEKR